MKKKILGMTSRAMLLVSILIGMASCQSETLSVSPMGDIVFDSESSTQKLKIKCNDDWYIMIDGAWGAWLGVDQKDGNGDATVTVSVKPNPNIESRKCVLRIYDYNDTEIALNVTQKGLYKGDLLLGAWKGEKEEYQLYTDGVLEERSETDLSETVLEFSADGSYMIWGKDGYYWKELCNNTYSVEDDLVILMDDDGGKDYEITSMTASKVTMTYKEEYTDGSTGGQCVKTVTRTYKKEEAWVTPETFQLKNYSVNLNVDGEYQIVSNGTDVTYESLNPYVATVDYDGTVTANFVGTAAVEVKANEGSHTFTVNVNSKYPKYKDPCLDFTKTESQIHAMYEDYYMGTDTEGGRYYRFANYYHVYDFVGGTLKTAILLLPSVDFDIVWEYLTERYYYYGYDEESNFVFFTNFIDILVGLTPYSSSNFGAGYSIYHSAYDFGVGSTTKGNSKALSPEKRFFEEKMVFMDFTPWNEIENKAWYEDCALW